MEQETLYCHVWRIHGVWETSGPQLALVFTPLRYRGWWLRASGALIMSQVLNVVTHSLLQQHYEDYITL